MTYSIENCESKDAIIVISVSSETK